MKMEKLKLNTAKSIYDVPVGFSVESDLKFVVKLTSNASVEQTHRENEFARRLVASFNACEGISIETLDNIRVSDAINSMYSAEKRAGIYQKEFERLKAQNAQLLDALQKISGSQADGIAPDDFPGWVDFFQETALGAIAATTQDQ